MSPVEGSDECQKALCRKEDGERRGGRGDGGEDEVERDRGKKRMKSSEIERRRGERVE